jgi:hypothetical protein
MTSSPLDDDDGPISAAAAPLPDLDGGALMQFLSSTLQDLEAAQGGTDDEARGLLAQLGAAMQRQSAAAVGAVGHRGALRDAQPQGPAAAMAVAVPQTDLEIAYHIDRWARYGMGRVIQLCP